MSNASDASDASTPLHPALRGVDGKDYFSTLARISSRSRHLAGLLPYIMPPEVADVVGKVLTACADTIDHGAKEIETAYRQGLERN